MDLHHDDLIMTIDNDFFVETLITILFKRFSLNNIMLRLHLLITKRKTNCRDERVTRGHITAPATLRDVALQSLVRADGFYPNIESYEYVPPYYTLLFTINMSLKWHLRFLNTYDLFQRIFLG